MSIPPLLKAFNEADHPRGQPENAGQFAPSEGASSAVEKARGAAGTKEKKKPSKEEAAADYKEHGTKAKAFKEWFGDWQGSPETASKVVKPDGSPEETFPTIVYHGTPNRDIDSFDPAYMGTTSDSGFYGHGHYFTTNKDEAQDYADKRGAGRGEVHAAYLNIRKPFLIDFRDYNSSVDTRRRLKALGVKLTAGDFIENREEFQSILKANGYDGVMAWRDDRYDNRKDEHSLEAVAFDPTQIKAVDNEGTFDPDDPKFRKSLPHPAHSLAARYVKAKAFDPSQPREPAGSEVGGQFASEGARAAVDKAKEKVAGVSKQERAESRQDRGDYLGGADQLIGSNATQPAVVKVREAFDTLRLTEGTDAVDLKAAGASLKAAYDAYDADLVESLSKGGATPEELAGLKKLLAKAAEKREALNASVVAAFAEVPRLEAVAKEHADAEPDTNESIPDSELPPEPEEPEVPDEVEVTLNEPEQPERPDPNDYDEGTSDADYKEDWVAYDKAESEYQQALSAWNKENAEVDAKNAANEQAYSKAIEKWEADKEKWEKTCEKLADKWDKTREKEHDVWEKQAEKIDDKLSAATDKAESLWSDYEGELLEIDEKVTDAAGDVLTNAQERLDEEESADDEEEEDDEEEAFVPRKKAFNEADHPRGQPENAGQFAPSEGAAAAVEKARGATKPKEDAKEQAGGEARKQKEAVVGKVIDEYAKIGMTPEEANGGDCYTAAKDIVAGIRAAGHDANFAFPMRAPTHLWVYSGGLHYDLETPQGVKRAQDLPFFKRNPELYSPWDDSPDDPLAGSKFKKSLPRPARSLATRYAEALATGQDAAAFVLGKAFAVAYPELELCVKREEVPQEKSLTVCSTEPPGVGWTYSGPALWTKGLAEAATDESTASPPDAVEPPKDEETLYREFRARIEGML